MAEHPEYGIIPTYKPEEYVWLKERLPIDLMRVDEEVIELPTLIQRSGEFTSSAIELREAAKEILERQKAIAAEALRTTPNQSGKQRSETAITSEIPLSEDVQAASAQYGVCRLDAALWQTLTEAFRSKNTSIRVVADLLNSGYMTPSTIQNRRRQDMRNVQVGK